MNIANTVIDIIGWMIVLFMLFGTAYSYTQF